MVNEESDEQQIRDAEADYKMGEFKRVRDLLRHRKGREEPKVRYERLGGDRPGRNVCVSGRITDDMDDKMDMIAEKGDTTRSKIVSDALETYIKRNYHRDTTAIPQRGATTWAPNTDSTLLTIVIQKDANGMYVGIVPSLEECYSCGNTLNELLVNLQKAINADLPPL